MQINFTPYSLTFRYPFKIAAGVRTNTPAVYVRLSHDGINGYGEATLPPYLHETQQSVIAFIESFRKQFVFKNEIENNLNQLHTHADGNYFAKAAIDIALHDWHSKAKDISVNSFLEITSRTSSLLGVFLQ